MNLRHTILGLLNIKPASGYDLKRIISDSDIFPWSGNNNQIYKCLIELQNEGLVVFETQVQDSLPNKKIYSITQPGLAELHNALREPAEPPEIQKDILIHLALSGQLSDIELKTLLQEYLQEIQVRLEMHKVHAAKAGHFFAGSRRQAFLWGQISRNLAAAYQTELNWLHEMLEGVDNFSEAEVIDKDDKQEKPGN